MAVIRLFGVLAKYGAKELTVHVDTFDEAMRALRANYPLVDIAIRQMNISILVNNEVIRIEDLLRPMSDDTIDIIPVVGGGGPALIILAGWAMEAGAAAAAGYIGGALALEAATVATLTSMLTQMGISLILAGISQILFKPPKAKSAEPIDNATSYTFNGAVNTTTQGNCVPVGFGRMRVGSQLLSANIQTFDAPLGAGVTAGATGIPEPKPADWISDSPYWDNSGGGG